MNTNDFIKRSSAIHGGKYDYSKTEYINSRSKVLIICPIHGEFWQKANDHIRGHGCRGCASNAHQTSFSEFKKRSIEIHGDMYIYDEDKYTSGSHNTTITCPVHGAFNQRVNSHLRGNGCPKCTKVGFSSISAERHIYAWSRIVATVYIIRCISTDERFYKIGLTTGSVSRRLSGKMPYKYEIIEEIKTNLYSGVYIEKGIKEFLREYKYRPKVKFGGYTECFKGLLPDKFFSK